MYAGRSRHLGRQVFKLVNFCFGGQPGLRDFGEGCFPDGKCVLTLVKSCWLSRTYGYASRIGGCFVQW